MASRHRRLQALVLLAVLAVVLLGLVPQAVSPETLRDWIVSFGALAPAAFVGLYLAAVFIPYGTTVMTVAAGLAFGPLWGGLLTYGVTLGACLLPFAVARRLGRDWVERRVGGSRVEKYAELINRNAVLIVFYLRLIPSLPYELQNYLAGVTRIGTGGFLLATALGIGPIILVLTFLGDGLAAPGSVAFWIAAGVYLLALFGPAALVLIQRRQGRETILTELLGE